MLVFREVGSDLGWQIAAAVFLRHDLVFRIGEVATQQAAISGASLNRGDPIPWSPSSTACREEVKGVTPSVDFGPVGKRAARFSHASSEERLALRTGAYVNSIAT